MIKSSSLRFRLLLASAALLGGATLRAQSLAGSDNFDDNTLTVGVGQRWRFNADLSGTGGTAFTEQNQHLEFTSTNPTGWNARALGWASPSSSGGAYGFNWTATVSLSNLTSVSTGYNMAGLEAYTLFDSGSGVENSAYYGMYFINSAAGGREVAAEWGLWNPSLNGGNGGYDRITSDGFALDDLTSAVLRLSWNASAQSLTAGYSLDSGATFTTEQVFSLNGAEAGRGPAWSNSFGLELTGVAIDTTVAAGQLSYDNMSVSAVPEPSTYAALVGAAALGLAAWRRRRTAS